MRKPKNRISWIVLVVLFLLGTVAPADIYAAPKEDAKVQSITVPFENSLQNTVCTWEFPYTDDEFLKPSDTFSLNLARASMGLAVSAFRTEQETLALQYETYLKAAGFSDIYAFGYDKPTSPDTLSGVIGWKKIDDWILIAASPCGQKYEKEWGGNLEVGDEERHTGFNRGAQILEEQIASYIKTYGLEGNKKLWLTGFSRASAVSNLAAADMIESGEYEDVFAYLFAVPRTTRNPVQYPGIYNICGQFDPVTQVPLESWGYARYGTDLYTPAEEMDSRYIGLALSASEVSYELTGDMFRNNPEVNLQLHLILEFLGEMFPTANEYAEKFQDILMNLWTEANPDTMGLIVTQAFSQLEDLDRRQEYSSSVFIDYMTYIMSQHLLEEQRQVQDGSWSPDQPIAENVMREHMPYTYIDWIFSEDDPEQLFHGPVSTRRLSLVGDVDVEIWMNGRLVRSVDHKGQETNQEESVDWSSITSSEELEAALRSFDNVFLMRNGTETLASLPMNQDFQVVVHADTSQSLIYYDVVWSPYTTFGSSEYMFTQYIEPGDYILNLQGAEKLTGLESRDGQVHGAQKIETSYSPTMEMATEAASKNHLTISGLLALLVVILLFILMLLFVCLILWIVHCIRRKKRGRPYSALFVIVPHVLLILLFTLLTQFFTVNMFAIGMVRQVCAALTMFVIFLLALRGLLRFPKKRSIIITAGLLVIAFVNFLIYQNSQLVSSSAMHFVVYCLCMALFTVLAISNFRKQNKKA